MEEETKSKCWISSLFKWKPTSDQELATAENKLLSYLKNPFKTSFVDIGKGWGLNSNKIRTIETEPTDGDVNDEPLVLLHGFASGVALWAMNLDELAQQNRKVYAVDVLGFGRSSRPHFPQTPEAEDNLTESIEKWRIAAGINSKFILLGHSFGGYLAFGYASKYPDQVRHLILADPWGVPERKVDPDEPQRKPPMWLKMATAFTPLAGLRAAGPWGPSLIEKLRPDIKERYKRLTGPDDADSVLNYIYHCNAQNNPSGEVAFKGLSTSFGWAKSPIITKIDQLDKNIAITLIYGAESWIDSGSGQQIQQQLGEDRVSIHVINGAGHHVYADQPEEFSQLVLEKCRRFGQT